MGFSIKVGNPLLIPFAQHDYIVSVEGNIIPVELQQFRSPYGGTVQAFYNGKVSFRFTGRTETLNFFSGQRLLYFSLALYKVNSIYWISNPDALFNKPFEKAIID